MNTTRRCSGKLYIATFSGAGLIITAQVNVNEIGTNGATVVYAAQDTVVRRITVE